MARKPYDRATGNAEVTQQRGGAALTTDHGIPVSDNRNSLRAVARGRKLLEDSLLREKFSTSITNASPSAPSTPVVRLRVAY